ncbi:MAG: hypothetical protein PHE68_00835 [Candidatus Peribacteraceae bacterium]|nr:hypothetical protein [Candidatus Peribacteraceae bacterium]MDD5074342.1 hypothetical protein [Candidatus Peribacteraceae bacterium]
MSSYADTDFVYIDTDSRTVIGPVKWNKAGDVIPLERPPRPEREGDDKRRAPRRKEYYIWGSYRSLKKLYNLEGKAKDPERVQTLDVAMGRALKEAYWDVPTAENKSQEPVTEQ